MLWSARIVALLTTIAAVAAAPANITFSALATSAHNTTNFSVLTTGVYEILRAEIYQFTVNITANASTVQTTQEAFEVTTIGVNEGALPVTCTAVWITIFTTYPAVKSLNCSDSAVSAALVQEEVWPEYGGFYLFIELK